MEFTIKSGSPEKQRSACVVVGVFDNRKPSLSADLVDRASGGYISEIIRRGDMEGKLGSTLLLHNVKGTLADRVLLVVGLGKERISVSGFRSAAHACLLNETGSYEAVVYLTEEKVKRREGRVAGRACGRGRDGSGLSLRSDEKRQLAEVRRPLRKLTLFGTQRSDLAAGEAAAARGLRHCSWHGSWTLARDLGQSARATFVPVLSGRAGAHAGAGAWIQVRGAGARADRRA
jgi:leucyl aminopeptidase